MEVIEILRRQFAMIGILSDQSTMSHPINLLNLMFLLMLFIDLIINGVYCFYGADNFQDYVNSAFTCSAVSVGIMAYVTLILEMGKVHEFLENLEKSINNREYNDLLIYDILSTK